MYVSIVKMNSSKDIYLKIKKKKTGNFPSFDHSIFLRKKYDLESIVLTLNNIKSFHIFN